MLGALLAGGGKSHVPARTHVHAHVRVQEEAVRWADQEMVSRKHGFKGRRSVHGGRPSGDLSTVLPRAGATVLTRAAPWWPPVLSPALGLCAYD